MTTQSQEREAFEKAISDSPYEKSIARFSEESAWPGNYRDIAVDLAWCMWQARAVLAAQPKAEAEALVELPSVPESVLTYIHAYGDSRADDDGLSALRIGEAVLALRRWAASLASAPKAAPAALSEERISVLALEHGFSLSTAYGQAADKLMPISDRATLIAFARAIEAELTHSSSKGSGGSVNQEGAAGEGERG